MKNNTARRLLILLLTANLVTGFFSMRRASLQSGGDSGVLSSVDRLLSILFLTRSSYVDRHNLKTNELFNAAFQGITQKLDPFSSYLEPEDFKDLTEMTEGKFSGIGITLSAPDRPDQNLDNAEKTDAARYCAISMVFPNSPALEAGLKSGDEIRAVNQQEIAPFTSLEKVSALLHGEKGSSLQLTIWRPSDQQLHQMKITRQIVQIPCVVNVICDPGNPKMNIASIGYLRLLEFSEPSFEKTKEALEWLLNHGAAAIILDLRDNPGGLITSAVDICSLFLEPEALIVTVRSPSYQSLSLDKSERFKEYRVPHKPQMETQKGKIPLVLLINENSASASEITAASLQDHKRATLIGEKSFGKGSVQTVTPFVQNSGLKLTIARYFPPDPNRKLIDKNGVIPDIVVPLSPEEKEKMSSYFDNIVAANPVSMSLDSLSAHDPQLHRAVQFLRSLSAK